VGVMTPRRFRDDALCPWADVWLLCLCVVGGPEHTKEGVQQLVKAEETQKSATPIRCIIVLLVLCAVMILILILKHSHR
jgi:hypothetical protein